MDPDTCLEELRKLLAKYKQQKDNLDEADVQDLVIHAEAIDDWMSKGGAPPDAWRSRRYVNEIKEIEAGLAAFSDENPELPSKRSIEDFYEAVRALYKEGRIR